MYTELQHHFMQHILFLKKTFEEEYGQSPKYLIVPVNTAGFLRASDVMVYQEYKTIFGMMLCESPVLNSLDEIEVR